MDAELAAQSDGELLGAFVRTRDEASFAELVRRHQGMVRGVSRRTMGSAADAEDVAQAAFIVLAKRARTVRRQKSVASWLHGVTRHLALSAVRREQRLKVREEKAVERLLNEATRSGGEPAGLTDELDAGLRGVPETYRLPLILHYLEGVSQAETAKQLGLRLGTLQVRLKRGRDLLRKRLVRRGMSAGAALAALAAAGAEAAGPSDAFVNATARAATEVMRKGWSGLGGLVSETAISISKGGLAGMLFKKLAVVSGLVAALALTATSVIVAADGASDGDWSMKGKGATRQIDIDSAWGKFIEVKADGTVVFEILNASDIQAGGKVTFTAIAMPAGPGRAETIVKAAATLQKGDKVKVSYGKQLRKGAVAKRYAWNIEKTTYPMK